MDAAFAISCDAACSLHTGHSSSTANYLPYATLSILQFGVQEVLYK